MNYLVVDETGASPIRGQSLRADKVVGNYIGWKVVSIVDESVLPSTHYWDGLKEVAGVYRTPEEQADYDKQNDINEKQNLVDGHLAKAIDDLMNFIDQKFNLSQADQAVISGATTIANLKAILLDRFSMTAGNQAVLQEFRDKYAAWITAKE